MSAERVIVQTLPSSGPLIRCELSTANIPTSLFVC